MMAVVGKITGSAGGGGDGGSVIKKLPAMATGFIAMAMVRRAMKKKNRSAGASMAGQLLAGGAASAAVGAVTKLIKK